MMLMFSSRNLHPETNATDIVGRAEAIGVNGARYANGSGVNGHEEIDGHSVTNGYELHQEGSPNGVPETNGRTTGKENGTTLSTVDFDCVVCGGGQAGLATARRLKAGGVLNCIVLDKNDVIGGIWQNRYDSVRLHASKDISQMPFGRIFPPRSLLSGQRTPRSRLPKIRQEIRS